MQNEETGTCRADPDLKARLVDAYGIEPFQAERILEDILMAYDQGVEEWIRSQHIRLQRQGLRNEEIYRFLADSLPGRRFTAPPLSVRQIRRLIYG